VKFFAATILRNGPVDLLPHFLDYYLRLGVDQIILCILREGMEERLAEIECIATDLPVKRYIFSGWSDDGQPQIRRGLEIHGCQPTDWVVHADLDELNEFPCPINELATAMEKQNKSAVHGHFIDRISADGRLTAAQPTPSLAEQYPVECHLTDKILHGFTQKIMLGRHAVTVSAGHHEASVPSGRHAIGSWRDYRVHHFKWRDTLKDRLQWALSTGAARDGWDNETRRFMDFLGTSDRIPITDPRIAARFVGAAAPNIHPRTDRPKLAH